MYNEQLLKEQKQLALFDRFKKIGIILLAAGGGLAVLSFLFIIIFLLLGSEVLALISELNLGFGFLAMEIGLPVLIVFSIFTNKKTKNIIEIKKKIKEESNLDY